MGELPPIKTQFSHPRDSRWYSGRETSTALYLKNTMVPVLQRAVGWAKNGERDYLSDSMGDILVNGLNALAFGKENCPFGIEIDKGQNVKIVDNPERNVDRNLHRKIKPKIIDKDITIVETFSLHGFEIPRNMEGFISFLLKLQKEKETPILIYGALDCPAIVLAKEVSMHEKMAFANDYYKLRFYSGYYFSKLIKELSPKKNT